MKSKKNLESQDEPRIKSSSKSTTPNTRTPFTFYILKHYSHRLILAIASALQSPFLRLRAFLLSIDVWLFWLGVHTPHTEPLVDEVRSWSKHVRPHALCGSEKGGKKGVEKSDEELSKSLGGSLQLSRNRISSHRGIRQTATPLFPLFLCDLDVILLHLGCSFSVVMDPTRNTRIGNNHAMLVL